MRWMQVVPALVLCAGSLSAQGFQGVITMRTGDVGANPVEMRVHVKGGRTAILVPFQGMGPTVEARMVLDPAAKKVTMLVPMAMPGAKGMKMTMDMTESAGEAEASEGSIRRLGTSQTIAGMSCDDYAITSQGETSHVCLTGELGAYTIPSMGGRPGASPTMPRWARQMGDRFPLKVWRPDGAVLLEVLSVTRGPVSDDLFNTSPEGFQDMSGRMPGGRRN